MDIFLVTISGLYPLSISPSGFQALGSVVTSFVLTKTLEEDAIVVLLLFHLCHLTYGDIYKWDRYNFAQSHSLASILMWL